MGRLAAGAGSGFARRACSSEPHVEPIVSEILALREAVLKAESVWDARFVTFWDFDGTILDGDCSEGLVREGRTVYKGLAQLAIEAGLSGVYGPGEFERFWADYQLIDGRVGHWLSYPFLVQMLRGARAADVRALAQKHFAEVLRKHLFTSSVEIIGRLHGAGVEVHVVSASGEIFVRAGSEAAGIPKSRMHGIRTAVRGGALTDELRYPVTYAEGKAARIRQILQSKRFKGRPAYVLAGFGNSFQTDGPFLKWIASQRLPAGRPLAVMVNGGDEPDTYKGLFRLVRQTEVVGG